VRTALFRARHRAAFRWRVLCRAAVTTGRWTPIWRVRRQLYLARWAWWTRHRWEPAFARSHLAAVREAIELYRYSALPARHRRRARRIVRRTYRRYPWARSALASVASPHGVGKDGQLAYDLDTRTWFGTLIGQLKALGPIPWYDLQAAGATGNGITDDTVPSQKWIASTPIGVYHAPLGNYIETQSLAPLTGAYVFGDGIDNTTFTIPPSSYGNFASLGLFESGNADVTLRDFHIDGQRRNGSNPANQAGLVLPGNGWYLSRLHFDDANWFGCFIFLHTDVTVIDCQSSRGGNNDHLGGGGNTNCKIIRHRWNANLVANAFDMVNGQAEMVDCRNYSASTAYFEGMTDSSIRDNVFVGGGTIQVQTDSGYSPATITNPLRINVDGNEVFSALVGAAAGINVNFHDANFGTNGPYNRGGLVRVVHNAVDSPQNAGIWFAGENPLNSAGGSLVTDNTIRNANVANTVTTLAGLGTIESSAINLSAGYKLLVRGNTCKDDRATPLQRHCIQVGVNNPGNGGHCDNAVIEANTCGLCATAVRIMVNTNSTAKIGYNPGFSPAGGQVAPGIAASTVLQPNPFNGDALVLVAAGTLTAIAVGGIPPPANQGFSQQATGGTLGAATYAYRISALNAAGETLASAETTIVVASGATNAIRINWTSVRGASHYNLYGRTAGAELFMARVEGCAFLDTGAIAPAGALPGADTTAGANSVTGITAAAPAGAVHSLRVPYGSGLKITYTVAPTETWFLD
jgi:hypothetical protein